MTKNEAFNIYVALETCKNLKDKEGNLIKVTRNFVKSAVKNLNLLKEDFDYLSDLGKRLQEKGNQYNQTRASILSSHALKDEKGEPVIENKSYVFPTPEIKEIVIKEVENKTKDILSDLTQLEKDLIEAEKEDASVTIDELLKLKEEDVPEESEFFIIESLLLITE